MFTRRDQLGPGYLADIFGREGHDLGIEGSLEQAATIVASMISKGTDGKAKPVGDVTQGTSSRINVIPGTGMGGCTPALVVFCFDNDSFDDRLREAERHVTIDCRETKLILFVTSQWLPRVWKRNYEAAFDSIPVGITIYLAAIGGLTKII